MRLSVLVAALPQERVAAVVAVAVAVAVVVLVVVVAAAAEEETAVVAVAAVGTERKDVVACNIVVGMEPLQRDYPSIGEPGRTNQPQLGETEKSEAGEMAASLSSGV